MTLSEILDEWFKESGGIGTSTLSSNVAHAAEFREDDDAVTSRDVGPSERWRGRSQHLSTTLQRKPSRQSDIPQDAAARVLPDRGTFELGNSRLVIKPSSAKAASNVRTTKSTSEIVRKAVIDVLAHTDSMEEALHRALESFGDRSTYWDQVNWSFVLYANPSISQIRKPEA